MKLRSIGIILTLTAAAALAQAGQQANIIKEIVVHGNTHVTTQAILANMRTKVGQPFLQETLDHDKENLLDLGFFQSADVRGTPLECRQLASKRGRRRISGHQRDSHYGQHGG